MDRVENIEGDVFDLITSRAVTNTSLLLSITNNIASHDTEYLFYKGSICQNEIKDAKIENYEIIQSGEHRNYLYIKREGLFDGI